jgi:hypothetical protein
MISAATYINAISKHTESTMFISSTKRTTHHLSYALVVAIVNKFHRAGLKLLLHVPISLTDFTARAVPIVVTVP